VGLLTNIRRRLLSPQAQKSTEIAEKALRLGMTPRQLQLNLWWAMYEGEQYADRKFDWDGREVASIIDTASIAASGTGDATLARRADLPIQFRKPTAPYHLAHVIVDRFTAMLYGEHTKPSFRVRGNPEAERFVQALMRAARTNVRFDYARTLAGAMGSVALSFKFVNGLPRIEVHDPRWATVTWADREAGDVAGLEVRFMTSRERRAANGTWDVEWYWYRRVLTDTTDTVWSDVPVGQGLEPAWDEIPSAVYVHNFGFCPAVWVQNSYDPANDDGRPDFKLATDMLGAIDALYSQANKGAIANSDPTLMLNLEQEATGLIRKGSNNALQLGVTEKAAYLEMSGTGIDKANAQAELFRERALEVCACVLDHPDKAAMTATEIERMYAAMLARCSRLREQYGEGQLALARKMLTAVSLMESGALQDAEGNRMALALPPEYEDVDGDGEPDRVDVVLGDAGAIALLEITWGPYFLPTPQDAVQSTTAATAAVDGGLIDRDAGTRYVAASFSIPDPAAMIANLRKEREEQEREQMAMMAEAQAQAQAGAAQAQAGAAQAQAGAPAGRGAAFTPPKRPEGT
jgi:hypothetical protein